ncbi:MAG TPA: hypothetical protein VGO67_25235 [Verrucomicrobiae bacterium]|jgi:hypothetical protein
MNIFLEDTLRCGNGKRPHGTDLTGENEGKTGNLTGGSREGNGNYGNHMKDGRNEKDYAVGMMGILGTKNGRRRSTALPENVFLGNEGEGLDEAGWALIAPFGEHPKSRLVKKSGRVVEEKFIQVLDNESADRLLSRENSLFRRIRRAMVGVPVYRGHPDLKDYAPETAGAFSRKEIIGTIDRLRKTGRGIEAHFVLTPAGADAVEREGCKYPSALWFAQPIGRRGEATLARPFKLLSAGLTAHPNICGVESLANATVGELGIKNEELGSENGGHGQDEQDGLDRERGMTSERNHGSHGSDRKKRDKVKSESEAFVGGELGASSPRPSPPQSGGEGVEEGCGGHGVERSAGVLGAVIAEESGTSGLSGLRGLRGQDGQDVLQNEQSGQAGKRGVGVDLNKGDEMKMIAGWLVAQGAALANSESPTESQVLGALQKLHTDRAGEVLSLGNEKSSLAGENEQLKSEVSRLSSAGAALENERADLGAQLAILKSGRATAVVDLAIARGKLNVAERAARIESLANAADFEKDSSALLASATRYRTAGSTESGKVLSNEGTESDARAEYCASVERHMKETGETDPIKAHHAVMQGNPGLAEKLKARGQA